MQELSEGVVTIDSGEETEHVGAKFFRTKFCQKDGLVVEKTEAIGPVKIVDFGLLRAPSEPQFPDGHVLSLNSTKS